MPRRAGVTEGRWAGGAAAAVGTVYGRACKGGRDAPAGANAPGGDAGALQAPSFSAEEYAVHSHTLDYQWAQAQMHHLAIASSTLV